MLTDADAASPDASSATWQAWTGTAWAAQPALTCTVATAAELSAAQAALASAQAAAALRAKQEQRARAAASREVSVQHFRGPCAAYCKPLAPCCCVSADGEAIFGCVLTEPNYFLPACLHMALCPQLGCDPRGGDENMPDYCCIPLFVTLIFTPFVCCLQDPNPDKLPWYPQQEFEPRTSCTSRPGPRPARPSWAPTAERPAPHACSTRLAVLRVCFWDWRCGGSTWRYCEQPDCVGECFGKTFKCCCPCIR